MTRRPRSPEAKMDAVRALDERATDIATRIAADTSADDGVAALSASLSATLARQAHQRTQWAAIAAENAHAVAIDQNARSAGTLLRSAILCDMARDLDRDARRATAACHDARLAGGTGQAFYDAAYTYQTAATVLRSLAAVAHLADVAGQDDTAAARCAYRIAAQASEVARVSRDTAAAYAESGEHVAQEARKLTTADVAGALATLLVNIGNALP